MKLVGNWTDDLYQDVCDFADKTSDEFVRRSKLFIRTRLDAGSSNDKITVFNFYLDGLINCLVQTVANHAKLTPDLEESVISSIRRKFDDIRGHILKGQPREESNDQGDLPLDSGPASA